MLSIFIATIMTIVLIALIAWNIFTKDSDERLSTTILIAFSSIFLFIAIESICLKDTPNAIDVYRGKTTLEITYKDGMPIDSVVVFKNKQ